MGQQGSGRGKPAVAQQAALLHAPGMDEGTVSTVKMEGSGWSKATALTGQKRDSSYLESRGVLRGRRALHFHAIYIDLLLLSAHRYAAASMPCFHSLTCRAHSCRARPPR